MTEMEDFFMIHDLHHRNYTSVRYRGRLVYTGRHGFAAEHLNKVSHNQQLLKMTNNHNEAGLSEVIGFILLLALVVAALSVWMVYVVPVNGREEEIAQMNIIKDQFTEYKFTLDALRTNIAIDNLSPVMTSTSFTLGTGGGNTQAGGVFLAMLKPIASYGTLSVQDTGDQFKIDSSQCLVYPNGNISVNITSLQYSSHNNYWIQQQYVYDLGGVFLYQTNGSVNRISPLISIANAANNSIVVYVVPVNLVGGGSITGNGPVRVDTRQRILPKYNISQDYYLNNQWVNLSIITSDNATAAVWQNVFTDTVVREQISSSAYTIRSIYYPTLNKTNVTISITGSNPTAPWDVALYVQRAEFYVTFNNIAQGLT